MQYLENYGEKHDTEGFEVQFFRVFTKSYSIGLANCYRPPKTSSQKTFDNICIIFEKLQSISTKCVLLGDLNLDLLDENKGKRLRDAMLGFNFKCALNTPSRVSALLDVILFTEDFPLDIGSTIENSTQWSDHSLVKTSSSIFC